MTWQPPTLTLRWGAYFRPDPEDESKVVTTVIAAKNAGLITIRSAVEKLRRPFEIENVSQYVEQLEEEAEERQAKAVENAKALGMPQQGAAPGQPGAKPPASPIAPQKGQPT